MQELEVKKQLAIEAVKNCQDVVILDNLLFLLSRSEVGLDKYGISLEDSYQTMDEFLTHALEEAGDFMNYLRKIKRMRNDT
jgi:hypothetical protein